MKFKKVLATLLAVLFIFFALPAKAFALWPFDLWKNEKFSSQTKFPPLIQRIIEKFKLNEGEVEKVIDEVKDEKEQEIRNRIEARLGEAVRAGIINEEQKKLLIDKHFEWQEKERQLWQERERWMQESGIDFEKLAPFWGGFGGLGQGKRGFGGRYFLGGF